MEFFHSKFKFQTISNNFNSNNFHSNPSDAYQSDDQFGKGESVNEEKDQRVQLHEAVEVVQVAAGDQEADGK